MASPSFQDYKDLGKTEIIAKRPSLAVRIGDLSDMLISAAAAMADRLTGWFAQLVAATFLDGAQGDDLTKLAADHWGINRAAATSAVAQVTIFRASPDTSAQNFTGYVVATARDSQGNQIQYTITTINPWAPSTGGAQVGIVTATVAGTSGNLTGPNQITKFVTATSGGVYTITASTTPAGGNDAETDEALRDRVRNFPATIRRGTIPALEYGSTQTTGAGVAKATAVDDGTGAVTVYVSDSSGNSSGSTWNVNQDGLSDDGTMTAKVAIELYNWAPAGSLISVTGGTIQTVNISVTLVVKLGIDPVQLVTDVQNAIVGRVNKLKIGDTLYIADIVNAVKAVDPDGIVNVAVTSPAFDTAPAAPGNLIRPGVVTVS